MMDYIDIKKFNDCYPFLLKKNFDIILVDVFKFYERGAIVK